MNKTAIRTIEILDVIATHEEGISLSEIVKAVKLPKTSVYDILKSLESCQAVYKKDTRDPLYSIGFRVFIIGHTYKKTSHLLTNSGGPMDNLVETLNKTVLLGKYYKDKLLIIEKKEPTTPVVVTPSIGETLEVDSTAMGLIFAAYLNPDSLDVTQLASIRTSMIEFGYITKGIDPNEMTYSIACPIFNFENKLAGVVGMISFYHNDIHVKSEGEQIKRCAYAISRNVGMTMQHMMIP